MSGYFTEELSSKDKLEKWSVIASIIYKISAAIGSIIVFVYLFEINFFPSGLSAADFIFFIFIALAFGILYLVLLFTGTIASIWPLKILLFLANKKSKKKDGLSFDYLRGTEKTLVSLAATVVLLLTILIIPNPSRQRLLLYFFASGFITLFFIEPNFIKNIFKKGIHLKLYYRIFLAILSSLPIIIYTGSISTMAQLVFEKMGVRILNTSIYLDKKEIDKIRAISKHINTPILGCTKNDEKEKIIVHSADVLWNSIGKTALISFKQREKEKNYSNEFGIYAEITTSIKNIFKEEIIKKNSRIRIDNSSIEITESKPALDPCFDLSNDFLFDSGNFTLNEEAAELLNNLANSIRNDKYLNTIIIVGHSDPRPLSKISTASMKDNQYISEMRAHTVAEELKKTINSDDIEIKSKGVGSTQLKVNCDNKNLITKNEKDKCNAINRRVEIQLLYKKD